MKTSTSKNITTFISIFLFSFVVRGAESFYANTTPTPIISPKVQSIAQEELSGEKPLTEEELRKAEETLGNPESDQYDEDKFCEVLRRALSSDLLNEADKMRATYRIEIASKNRPGTTVSDFRFDTRSGESLTLLGLETSKPIVLLFYDPDCDHCVQTIARLQQTDIPANAEIVAIYAEDDRDRWEETNSLLPEDWTVGFAVDPIQDEETYIFLTSPTLYLLDPQKTILLKDTTLPAIEETLHSQSKRSPGK